MSEYTGTFAEVTYREVDGIPVVTFMGEIDETNADTLFKKVYDIFSGKYVIFNFSGLTYGNSKFLGYISSMYEYMEEKEGKMIICEFQPAIFDMFDISGIFVIIPSAPTLAEAVILMKTSM